MSNITTCSRTIRRLCCSRGCVKNIVQKSDASTQEFGLIPRFDLTCLLINEIRRCRAYIPSLNPIDNYQLGKGNLFDHDWVPIRLPREFILEDITNFIEEDETMKILSYTYFSYGSLEDIVEPFCKIAKHHVQPPWLVIQVFCGNQIVHAKGERFCLNVTVKKVRLDRWLITQACLYLLHEHYAYSFHKFLYAFRMISNRAKRIENILETDYISRPRDGYRCKICPHWHSYCDNYVHSYGRLIHPIEEKMVPYDPAEYFSEDPPFKRFFFTTTFRRNSI